IALLPGSPAIDTGDDCVTEATHCGDPDLPQLTTDQRGPGFQRKVGSKVDLGAYECPLFVTNTSDSGPGSLRQAILTANSQAGANTIEFAITTASPWIIQLASALPTLSDAVNITGPGANLLTVRRSTGGNY